MAWLEIRVWVDDDVTLSESSIEAISDAAANEAYEQVQVAKWEAK